MDYFSSESIASISVLKDEAAEKFGQKGKTGLIVLLLKDEQAKSDNELQNEFPKEKLSSETKDEEKGNSKLGIRNSSTGETAEQTPPVFLVLEHSGYEPNTKENGIDAMAKAALNSGIRIQDIKMLDPQSISSVSVFNDEQAEVFGEGTGKKMVIVILKEGYSLPLTSQSEDQKDFIIYPTPADDLVKIKISLKTSEFVKIIALDNTNKPIATLTNSLLEKGEHEFMWEVSHLAPGLYIISLMKGEKSVSKKVEIR